MGMHAEAYEAYLRAEDATELRPEIETLPYPDGTIPRAVVNRTLEFGENIPIYVISMDRDLARRRILANNVLGRVHNPVTFVRATPKDVFTDEFGTLFDVEKGWQLDSRYGDPNYNSSLFGKNFREDYARQFHFRPMKEGEIGLAISHYRIWTHAYHSGLSHVIVLEDDAEFANFKKDSTFRIPETLRDKDWDLLYFGGFEIFPKVQGTTFLEGAKRVTHFVSGVSYALSRSGLEKVLAAGYHRHLMPLDEFLPVLTSPSGHFRIDIRTNSLQVKNNKLNAYATEPKRIVESDTSMSNDFLNPTPYVKVSCDPKMSAFRFVCQKKKNQVDSCEIDAQVVLRVDDRTAYFTIAKKQLLTQDSLELWNNAKRFCEVETRRWWKERSLQRTHENSPRTVEEEIAHLEETCIRRTVQCASIFLKDTVGTEKQISVFQKTAQGGVLIDTRAEKFGGDITDSIATVVLDSLNETSAPSYHVPGDRLGRRVKKENEIKERQELRRSTRPSVMIVDHRDRIASILSDWYNFVVDRFTNLPSSIVRSALQYLEKRTKTHTASYHIANLSHTRNPKIYNKHLYTQNK